MYFFVTHFQKTPATQINTVVKGEMVRSWYSVQITRRILLKFAALVTVEAL
jgi:hypothetical protein